MTNIICDKKILRRNLIQVNNPIEPDIIGFTTFTHIVHQLLVLVLDLDVN